MKTNTFVVRFESSMNTPHFIRTFPGSNGRPYSVADVIAKAKRFSMEEAQRVAKFVFARGRYMETNVEVLDAATGLVAWSANPEEALDYTVRASNAVDTYFADRTAGGFVTYRNGQNLAAKFTRQEAEAVAVEFLKGFTVSMNVSVAQVLDGNRQVVAEYEWIGNGPRRRAKVGVPILLVQVVRVGDSQPSFVSYFNESKPEDVSLNFDINLARLFFTVEEAWPAFMAAKTWAKVYRVSITTAREGLQ
jgi:hypothetical protein